MIHKIRQVPQEASQPILANTSIPSINDDFSSSNNLVLYTEHFNIHRMFSVNYEKPQFSLSPAV